MQVRLCFDCVIVEYLKNYANIKSNDSTITSDEIIDGLFQVEKSS